MNDSFLDSDLRIYMFDEQAPAKKLRAMELTHDQLQSGEGVISFQVVQETLNVLSRKMVAEITPRDVDAILSDVLPPLWKIMPSEAVYRRARSTSGPAIATASTTP